jgi:hypothetical protein
MRRSSHGSRATSSSWNINSSAACRPKNLATVRTSFLPAPDVKNRTSTIATFTPTNAHNAHRAAVVGGMVPRRSRWLVATIANLRPGSKSCDHLWESVARRRP